MAIDDSYTKSLLHLDGSNGSTTFTDESGKTWTASGDAKISTASPKFGSGELILDGTGDLISTPHHDDFDFGAGSFTIDWWANFTSLPGSGAYSVMVAKRPSAGGNPGAPFVCFLWNTGSAYLLQFLANSFTPITASWDVACGGNISITIETWHHFAFLRYGNLWDAYYDGIKSGATVSSGITVLNNNSVAVSIGAHADTSNPMTGKIDEVRFSKGIARWTDEFTPPDWPYGIPRLSSPMWFF